MIARRAWRASSSASAPEPVGPGCLGPALCPNAWPCSNVSTKTVGPCARPARSLPCDRAVPAGRLAVGGGHEIYFEECGTRTASRPCSSMAAPVAARTRPCAGSTTPGTTASSSSTSADAAARRRTHLSKRTPPGTWSPIWSACASTSASRAGSCSAARGDPRSRSPTPRSTRSASARWCCAASSCCAGASSSGSTRRAAAGSFRMPTKPIRAPSRRPSGRHHRRLLQAAARPRSEGAARGRARLSVWEGTTLSLIEDSERIRLFATESYALAFARIECHYFVNRGFFDRDDQLPRTRTG